MFNAVNMMVSDHQGAIAIAEQHALRTMANDGRRAQAREIAQMRQWPRAWYEAAGDSGDSLRGSENSMRSNNCAGSETMNA